MNREIRIDSLEQGRKICELAGSLPYEVWLRADSILVNAASMLSMLTMVGKNAMVEAEDDGNASRFVTLVHELA